MYLKLRQERIKHGWSQEYVAEKLDITPEAVCYMETGQRKPSYDVLVKLEKLFHRSHRTLFAVVDETPISQEQDITKGRKKEATRYSEKTEAGHKKVAKTA